MKKKWIVIGVILIAGTGTVCGTILYRVNHPKFPHVGSFYMGKPIVHSHDGSFTTMDPDSPCSSKDGRTFQIFPDMTAVEISCMDNSPGFLPVLGPNDEYIETRWFGPPHASNCPLGRGNL
jgi:hypothetical protein